MKRLMQVAVTMFVAIAIALSIRMSAQALSPFQTVAGVGGPMPSTVVSCVQVAVSSITASQVLASNAVRESLYVMNVSSINTTGQARPSHVAVFVPSTATNALAFTSQPGAFMTPHVPNTGTFTDNNTYLWMQGGSVYQGALFAIAEGSAAVVNACEFNP